MMRPLLVGLALLLLATGPAPADAKTGYPPDAAAATARGEKLLVDALDRATKHAWVKPQFPRPIALVVDMSTPKRRLDAMLAKALGALPTHGSKTAWFVAPLGEPLPKKKHSRTVVSAMLDAGLDPGGAPRGAIPALLATLAKAPRRAVIVYVVGSHAQGGEDSVEVLLKLCRGKQASLSVIGPEAAFGRSWKRHPSAGGDSAFMRVPQWFPGTGYHPAQLHTTFMMEIGEAERGHIEFVEQKADGDIETLLDSDWSLYPRAGPFVQGAPLPSGFGPYALTRACAVSSGTYVLWGTGGGDSKVTVRYDYRKCDRYPPDLRSRKVILKDLKSGHPTRAIAEAWALVAPTGLIDHAAPNLDRKAMTWGRRLGKRTKVSAKSKAELEAFLPRTQARRKIFSNALAILGAAKFTKGKLGDRHRAELDLFAYVLRTLQFHNDEIAAATRKALDAKLMDDPQLVGRFDCLACVLPGRNPALIIHSRQAPHDSEKLADLLSDRRRMLDIYYGTPFAEVVAFNGISTFVFQSWKPVKTKVTMGKRSKEGPSGSGSGGPTTGK